MSLGEDRVRVKFNPSADTLVDQIKQETAKLIDLCETFVFFITAADGSVVAVQSEQTRLARLAQTAYEEAAMWAVKAATTNKP